MILIAGGDVHASDEAAGALFGAGHMPIVAEWLAYPLLATAQSGRGLGTPVGAVLQPIVERLLARCDSVLRMKGTSSEADAIVALARARGVRVFFSVQEALDG